MNLKIEPRPEYLLATLSGPFDLPQSLNAIREIFAACGSHGLRKILFDMRTVEGNLNLMDRFDLGRGAAELQRVPLRVAVLAREDQVWPDRFAETVANNRGLVTKVTTDQAEALAWLNRDAAQS